MDRMSMEDEQHGQEHGFSNDQWVQFSGYDQSPNTSPMHEYGGFGFISTQNTPIEPNLFYGRMGMPANTMHPQLQPLQVPPWPSMLTSQSSYTASVISAAPAPTPPPPPPPPPPSEPAPSTLSVPHPAPPQQTKSGNQRKTLTDADRRRMCQYHEENPTIKQTEIGAMFGVERNTVSKVLRQKEKYLSPDDGSRSPVKRAKGKFPDIERALSNWARNYQKQGHPLTDSAIKEKARQFATTVGSSDNHTKLNSSSWLEKFKQKNGLMTSKSRKNSGGIESKEVLDTSTNNTNTAADTPNALSPISPDVAPSPSVLSSSRSQDNLKHETSQEYLNFSHAFRSHSTTSLSSAYGDTAETVFSGGPASPTSPFFSPDTTAGPSPCIPTSQQARLPPLSTNQSRPRSQTFPMLAGDPNNYGSPPPATEALPGKYMQAHLGMNPLESPLDSTPAHLQVDDTISPQQSQHATTSSSLSMAPPPTPHNSKSNCGLVTPVSPSQDDARRALEVVINFFQHQPYSVDPQEYMTLGKLMEKLRVYAGPLPGGLHRIPEQDVEATKMEQQSLTAGL